MICSPSVILETNRSENETNNTFIVSKLMHNIIQITSSLNILILFERSKYAERCSLQHSYFVNESVPKDHRYTCTIMCSDTKEYPLKLSGYSRVQIPCTLQGFIYSRVLFRDAWDLILIAIILYYSIYIYVIRIQCVHRTDQRVLATTQL